MRPEERAGVAQPTTGLGEIRPECAGDLRLDRNLPVAATLTASDRDHEPAVRIVVKIRHIEPDRLPSPQTPAEEEGQECAIMGRGRRREHGGDVAFAQRAIWPPDDDLRCLEGSPDDLAG